MRYDEKFRKNVLNFVEDGHTQEETRKIFKIGENTIRQWKKLKNETGGLVDRPLKRKWRKIDPEKLIRYFEEKPKAFDREAAVEFGCSAEAIRKSRKKLNIPYKKENEIYRANQEKLTEYIEQITKI